MLISFTPYLMMGSMRFLPFGPWYTCGRASSTPNIVGILGPEMSASTRPTFAPLAASATARLAATVLLPTPPLPEATAMIFFTPGRMVLLLRMVVTREVIWITTLASLSTIVCTARSQASWMSCLSGQAGVVSTTVNDTVRPSTLMSSTMLSVIKSCPKSGSSTKLRAWRTASIVSSGILGKCAAMSAAAKITQAAG